MAEGIGPLAGLVVVDCTRVLAGPYCTMVLADLGARVIKVERPDGGDDARQIGPFVEGRSAYFGSLNRGKESIALDLKDEADAALFERLVARADVLVENYRPGTLERLGFGWEALHARHPRLILASASGFGQTGPDRERPAYDLVVQAMGGIMSLTGQPGGAPTRVGTSIGDISAGLFTTIGILGALHDRARTGQGRHVDVSMLDCQVALLENAIARYGATGEVPGPIGSRHPSITPFQALRTADGWIVIAAGNDGLFAKLCTVIERPDVAEDPRFGSNYDRTTNVDALAAELEAALAVAGTDAWLARLGEAGVPCGPIQDVAQVLAHPQVRARNMAITSAGGDGPAVTMPGNPVKLGGFEDPPERRAAPELDADRAAILRWLQSD